jgi:hypothetical protein
MVRIGVSIYLMLIAFAGPWFCCCTPAHVSDLLTALRPRQEQAPEEPPPAPSPQCRCGQHKPAAPSGKQPQKHEPKPAEREDGRPCPCQEQRSQSAQVVALDRGPELPSPRSPLQVHALDSAPFLAPGQLLPPDAAETLPGASALPFLTAQDLLRSLHRLRC